MSKIDPNKLLISSDFYSVQGEGISSGVPSYFVRLGTCNLTCGMSRLFANNLLKEKSLEEVAVVSTGEAKNGLEKFGPFFMDEFIGKSKNSSLCKLKNPEVLKFYFSKRKNIFYFLPNFENGKSGRNFWSC